MWRNTIMLIVAAAVIALPFLFQREEAVSEWRSGDPIVTVITPHNEAIRYEFGEAFAAWHHRYYGRPCKVDWRVIGGTSEIMRNLASECVSSFRAWWSLEHGDWPEGGAGMMLDRRFKAEPIPAAVQEDPGDLARWRTKAEIHRAFRNHDSPEAFGAGIDVFFGGGVYDHGKAAKQGLTVAPWNAGDEPDDVLTTPDGRELIPEHLGGETWRSPTFFSAVVSTFGICYNPDRLADLGIESPPGKWSDLVDPAYFRQIGVADPTKSGSISKAFEMIIHEQCYRQVRESGFSDEDIDRFEKALSGGGTGDVPELYQTAVERGWLRGVRLVQRIGANARYFTDSAGRVPIDVSMGNAAAGLAIDFYGRFQAENSRSPDGKQRMFYVTPEGGSSVSGDPISLLRGAPHRESGVRFLHFVLGPDGQRLWNYRPGAPGGPRRFALRRLPSRRDFYPSDDPEFAARHAEHRQYTVDAIESADVNPYALASRFTYRPRWTARHFSAHRKLVRAMCLDAGEELRSAWETIILSGGPGKNPAAMAALQRMPTNPEELDWESASDVLKRHDELDLMRQWTLFFRDSYREARHLAEEGHSL